MAGLGPTEAQTVRLSPGIVRQTNLGGKWWEILEVGNISSTHSFFFLLKNPGIPREHVQDAIIGSKCSWTTGFLETFNGIGKKKQWMLTLFHLQMLSH